MDIKDLYVLDLGAKALDNPVQSGRILACTLSGLRATSTIIFTDQPFPDGITFSDVSNRLYWSNMGIPGLEDGCIMSCKLNGSDVQVIVPEGKINTPKQVFVDDMAGKLYAADREGLRIMRCNLDGSGLETFIQSGDCQYSAEQQDATKWCIGVAISSKSRKIFWSLKGPARGSRGQILSANLENPDEKETLMDSLPEPVDLFFSDERETLYWTDRGELPYGNTLNGLHIPSSEHRILANNFHDPVGLCVDGQYAYVVDLGGSLYRCNLDSGGKERVFQDESCAFTGIALVPQKGKKCML